MKSRRLPDLAQRRASFPCPLEARLPSLTVLVKLLLRFLELPLGATSTLQGFLLGVVCDGRRLFVIAASANEAFRSNRPPEGPLEKR